MKVQLSRSLLRDQTHKFTHVPSCVKGKCGTICRYRFFSAIVAVTGFGNDDSFTQRRRVENQWLNSFIRAWRRVFHFNMDARLLFVGHGSQAGLYVIKYVTKHVTEDKIHTIKLAALRHDQRANTSASPFSKGFSRLMSLAYSASGVLEMGGPLACLLIHRGSAGYFSHASVRFFLFRR